MRIIVPIKQVPETSAVRMDPETGTMIREGVEAIVNPLDLYAIEAALRLKEERGGEAIAVTMGPPKAEDALREAVAMGCDRAVLLSDKAFAGADTWATGRTLARAIRRIGEFDLVICGERATDGDTGQVGPGLGAFLDLPVATYVARIEISNDGSLLVHRLVEEGYEALRVQLPAVVTVVKEIADPRLPTLRGKRRARAMEIPTWGPKELDLDATDVGLQGSPTRVVKIFRPRLARECRRITANDEDSLRNAASRVVETLKKKNLL